MTIHSRLASTRALAHPQDGVSSMISHSAPVHVTELIVMPVNRYLVDSLASHESVIMPLHDQAINFNYLLLQHLIAI